jgi:hypothetical protein
VEPEVEPPAAADGLAWPPDGEPVGRFVVG